MPPAVISCAGSSEFRAAVTPLRGVGSGRRRRLRYAAQLLACIAIACPAFGAAQSAEAPAAPRVVMHRDEAGELDATGWAVADSTEGAFSVSLPYRYNDFTLQPADATSAIARTDVVGSRNEDGVKFSASRVVYRGGAEVARRMFRRVAEGDIGPGVAARQASRLAQLPLVDVERRKEGVHLFQRVVLAEPDLITLVVEVPQAVAEEQRPRVATFFASLRVRARALPSAP